LGGGGNVRTWRLCAEVAGKRKLPRTQGARLAHEWQRPAEDVIDDRALGIKSFATQRGGGRTFFSGCVRSAAAQRELRLRAAEGARRASGTARAGDRVKLTIARGRRHAAERLSDRRAPAWPRAAMFLGFHHVPKLDHAHQTGNRAE